MSKRSTLVPSGTDASAHNLDAGGTAQVSCPWRIDASSKALLVLEHVVTFRCHREEFAWHLVGPPYTARLDNLKKLYGMK